MVIITKPLFDAKIAPGAQCKDLIHEWTKSCIVANLKLPFLYYGKGIFFFYLPIYLIKLLIDYKKINKKYLKNLVVSYLRSESFGLGFGALVLGTICAWSNLLGGLRYYTIGVVPGFVGGASLLFEDNQNRVLNSAIWASLVVEALFKNAYHLEIIKYSASKETILFMVASSILMCLLTSKDRKKIPLNIWFYKPSSRKHRADSLSDYVIESLKYFGLGYGLSSARLFISGVVTLQKKSMKTFLQSVLNKKHLKFGMVFGMYAALFRGISHFLQRYSKDEIKNAAIAGFVAGMSYHFQPTTNILAIAIVTIFQVLCYDFCTNRTKFRKIPLAVLIYMICNGILLHNRAIAPVTCPKYYFNMIKFASGGLIDQIYDSVFLKYINPTSISISSKAEDRNLLTFYQQYNEQNTR